jgi:hypothetical protein
MKANGSVKVADCPCLLAADCVQSLIAFRRLMLEIAGSRASDFGFATTLTVS